MKTQHLHTAYDDNEPADFYQNIIADFHTEFLKTNQRALWDNYRNIRHVTEDEIVWKNRLVHWIGYDPIYSRSNVSLLDLADSKASHDGKSLQREHRNPFDSILHPKQAAGRRLCATTFGSRRTIYDQRRILSQFQRITTFCTVCEAFETRNT